jgi:hypothetical protein
MTSLQRKCTKQHDPKGKTRIRGYQIEVGSLLVKEIGMDHVENGINAWAETERDPNVSYAIFEQSESKEKGRGYQKA